MYCIERPDGCPWLWHSGSSRKHWAAFHTLDCCRLPLSPIQPNHKSSLPGELAALTPALCFPHLGLASCQDGDPDTSSRRRDRGWSWATWTEGPSLAWRSRTPSSRLFSFCLSNHCLGLLPRPPHTSLLSRELRKSGSSTTPRNPSLPSPFLEPSSWPSPASAVLTQAQAPQLEMQTQPTTDSRPHSLSPGGNTNSLTKGRFYVSLGPSLVISFPLPIPLPLI